LEKRQFHDSDIGYVFLATICQVSSKLDAKCKNLGKSSKSVECAMLACDACTDMGQL